MSWIKGFGRLSRVLVTGAAGFIGSHLVERLLREGHEVVGVDAFTANYARGRKERNLAAALGEPGFCLVEGDLLDLDLRPLLDGADAVFHLAGEPGVRQSWGAGFRRYAERNVVATEGLLAAASEAGVGRFVFASSSSVYGGDRGGPLREGDPLRPASPYGLTKLAAEELVALYARERGLPATVLRYFTVYGPRQRPEMAFSRFVEAALHGGVVEVYGDGCQVREMTFVSDAVAATAAAMDAPCGTYNVGGGARTTVRGMLLAVERATGRSIEVVHRPEAAGDVRSTWADSGKAASLLGYSPRVGLEDGVGEQARWTARESLAAAV